MKLNPTTSNDCNNIKVVIFIELNLEQFLIFNNQSDIHLLEIRIVYLYLYEKKDYILTV